MANRNIEALKKYMARSMLFFFLSAGDFIEIRRPQRQIVTQQLHDGGWVAVLVLLEGVEVGDGIIEGLLSKLAGDVWTVQDLVVEDRVVQGQTQTNWMRRLERLWLRHRLTVAILCFLDDLLAPK